jgi:hypothetical protein
MVFSLSPHGDGQRATATEKVYLAVALNVGLSRTESIETMIHGNLCWFSGGA